MVFSNDRGLTWSSQQFVDSLQTVGIHDPDNPGEFARTGDIIPEPAVDPATGQLYLVWQDGRLNENGQDDVLVSTSVAGGLTGTGDGDGARAALQTGPVRRLHQHVLQELKHPNGGGRGARPRATVTRTEGNPALPWGPRFLFLFDGRGGISTEPKELRQVNSDFGALGASEAIVAMLAKRGIESPFQI